MKKIFWPVIMAGIILIGSCLAAAVYAYDGPSLFHNDEAWYKDSIAPLRTRNGQMYIPIDMLNAFDEMNVIYGNEKENILVFHTDGRYVSILYSDNTAIVNGDLHTEVHVFREGGTYYVHAEWIADLFSLKLEYAADGENILRIADGTEIRNISELLAVYDTAAEYPEEPPVVGDDAEQPDGVKRIYLVTADNYENMNFPAAENIVENSGLVCTVFVHEGSSMEKIHRYYLQGSGGICAASAKEAEALNNALETRFMRRAQWVLLLSEDADKEVLYRAGYVVVEPDFVVNYRTDPDLVFEELVKFLETEDSAVVQISGDGCSQRMIALLCNLTADPTYCRTEKLLP